MARDTTATDRLALDRPELLADWASSWDELVELIDEDLIQSGQTADRPDTGDHDEQLFLDYEAQTLYYWDADASSWEAAIDFDISDHADDSEAHHDEMTWQNGGDSVGTGQYTVNAGSGLSADIGQTIGTIDLEYTGSEYTDADAIAAIEAESPLTLEQTQVGVTPSMGGLVYPFSVQAGHNGTNLGMAIVGDPDGTNHGNLNWHHSNGNYIATISGDGDGDHLSIYVADVDDVSDSNGSQKKMMDWHCGSGASNVDFPNLSQMRLWEQTGSNPVQLDMYGSPGENAMLRWHSGAESSPGSGTLSYGLWEDGGGTMQFYDYTEGQVLFEYTGSGLRIPTVEDGDGDVMMDGVAAQGTVDLSSGAATVSTGITSTGTHIDVHLDPSGDGANSSDVKVSARAFWDNSEGEYMVEILEDGTSVGNPTIGYKVVTS